MDRVAKVTGLNRSAVVMVTPLQADFAVKFWGAKLALTTGVDKVRVFQRQLLLILKKRDIRSISVNYLPNSTIWLAMKESGLNREVFPKIMVDMLFNADGGVSLFEMSQWSRLSQADIADM